MLSRIIAVQQEVATADPEPNALMHLIAARTHLLTGADGAVVWYREGLASMETIDGGLDVSAASVDALGRGWAAGAGRICVHQVALPADGISPPVGRWAPIWRDPSWKAPIVSLFTDLGIVIAMTADGGIIEGRAQRNAGGGE